MSVVTISAFQPGITWPFGGSTATLRYTYTSDFVDSTGTPILHGLYKDVPCTIAGGIVSVGSHTILSTLDALVNPLVTLNAQFIDERGAKRSWLFQNFSVPTTTPTTMGALTIFNQGSSLVLPPDWYLNAIEVQNLINIAQGTLNDASDVVKGRTFLSVAPAVAATPIARGINDTTTTMQAPLLDAGGTVFNAKAYGCIGDGATNDRAALNTLVNTTMQAITGGGTLVLSKGDYLLGSGMTFPANVNIRFEKGARLLLSTASVYPILGTIEAGPYQIFTNAVASQGTITFTNNRTLRAVYGEWWGAVGDDSTDNATFLNAASNALVTNNASGFGNGVIKFGPGIYRIGSLWTVGSTTGGGDTFGSFTGISLQGSNGYLGTQLKWTGSTGGQMVKIVRGRHFNCLDIRFNNGVAVGTTIGLWLSGPPNLGEQTSFGVISNCAFTGFNVGAQAGDVGGSAAGELLFSTCRFESNNTGYLGASSGNSLVIYFHNCSCYGNTAYGLNLGTGSGDTHILGGGYNGNDVDIGVSLGWNGTVSIEGLRLEISAANTGSIINSGNTGSLRVANCRWLTTDTVPTWGVVQGANFLQMDSCSMGLDGETGWIAYSGGGNATGSLQFTNTRIQNTTQLAGLFLLETGTTGQVGMRYQSFGNFYTTAGAVTKFDDIIAGIVGLDAAGAVIRISQSKITSGNLTADVLALGNQVTTPSVQYGTRFTTGNSGATSYTNFLNGSSGQTITIIVADANSTFVNGATIATRSGSNITAGNGLTYSFQLDGTVWRQLN